MLALLCAISLPSKADEGMWLLQMMQEKHLIDRLKAQGLLLEADDVYSPNKISLKDAVGIFGGGCTGEIISPDGLILTNHHPRRTFQVLCLSRLYLLPGSCPRFWRSV